MNRKVYRSLAAEQMHQLVPQGRAELHLHHFIFRTSVAVLKHGTGGSVPSADHDMAAFTCAMLTCSSKDSVVGMGF